MYTEHAHILFVHFHFDTMQNGFFVVVAEIVHRSKFPLSSAFLKANAVLTNNKDWMPISQIQTSRTATRDRTRDKCTICSALKHFWRCRCYILIRINWLPSCPDWKNNQRYSIFFFFKKSRNHELLRWHKTEQDSLDLSILRKSKRISLERWPLSSENRWLPWNLLLRLKVQIIEIEHHVKWLE